EGFDEVFIKNEHRVTVGGQFAPNGMAEKVDGGFRLSGAWNFGSGTGHSQYVVAGFIPLVSGEMIMDDHTGLPDMQVAVIPREQINFTDGWHVQGLKGTGSYDYNVADLFVPEHRTFPLFTRAPYRGGHTFKLGVMPLTGAGHAGWALGVARSQLDDVLQLAKEKTRMGDPTTLSHKLTFQRNLAHHEGMWRAARAGVVEAFTRVEQAVASGEELSVAMRLDMRVSATYATEACREICQFVHLAAGTAAIREGTRIERAFRDMYTGTQHAFINERTYTEAASVMLGLINDSTAL
ncbi:MAG: alkylation response protein AidB-like acyl-CoA dehydrogenase, partial [Bacteroidia bacterium]